MSQVTDSVFEAQCRLTGILASTPAQLEAARQIAVAAGKWPKRPPQPVVVERAPTKAMLFLVTVPEVIVTTDRFHREEKVVLDPGQIEADIRETLYLHGELRFDKVIGAAVKFIENEDTKSALQKLEPDLTYHFDEEPDALP